ncbi:MAG TPA: L-histidine N(alpha)-methyltransferase [Acidimicrobiales bacterium]|nr:L-histidine N(alpha)-methyltransferase [Acidimicrobiales bacterium]
MTDNPTIEVHLTDDDLRGALERDVRAGLTAPQKTLPPVWFYDARGSELFDEITRLPEYYLTRAERRLLETHAAELAAMTRSDTLVELGAGTCDKSRVLLDAMRDDGTLGRYVPFDVSDSTIWGAAKCLVDDYPGLAVHAVVGDFHRHLDRIPAGGRRTVAFLGSTLGNLGPVQRQRFLFDLDCVMTSADCLVIGADLVKEPARLVAAYDDAAGVTAEFNRNVLHVLNRELDADFDVAAFEHVARWDPQQQWMEMRLRATRAQTVRIDALELEIEFAEGEDIHTEISAKFTKAGFEEELYRAGFVAEVMWEDPEGFLLTVATPYC